MLAEYFRSLVERPTSREHGMERRRPRQPPTRPLVLLTGPDCTREPYATSLTCFGFDTMTVDGGADVYTQAWQTRPENIVTEMPPQPFDGWDFIRHVMSDPRTREIPVVIVTTQAQAAARERAQREGCAAFLVKP